MENGQEPRELFPSVRRRPPTNYKHNRTIKTNNRFGLCSTLYYWHFPTFLLLNFVTLSGFTFVVVGVVVVRWDSTPIFHRVFRRFVLFWESAFCVCDYDFPPPSALPELCDLLSLPLTDWTEWQSGSKTMGSLIPSNERMIWRYSMKM